MLLLLGMELPSGEYKYSNIYTAVISVFHVLEWRMEWIGGVWRGVGQKNGGLHGKAAVVIVFKKW
jgi:hypothetical protein